MKTAIKIQLVKIKRMTPGGTKQWSPQARRTLHPYTFHAQKGLGAIPTNQLNSKKKIADLVWAQGGEGLWDVRAPCPNKHTKTKLTMKTLVRIELKGTGENEYKYQIITWQPKRLSRYKAILNWGDQSFY
jgi:hypothetical protein